MTVRMKLTERERELVEAFRTKRAIYNSALADTLMLIQTNKVDPEDAPSEFWAELPVYKRRLAEAILALRKED